MKRVPIMVGIVLALIVCALAGGAGTLVRTSTARIHLLVRGVFGRCWYACPYQHRSLDERPACRSGWHGVASAVVYWY